MRMSFRSSMLGFWFLIVLLHVALTFTNAQYHHFLDDLTPSLTLEPLLKQPVDMCSFAKMQDMSPMSSYCDYATADTTDRNTSHLLNAPSSRSHVHARHIAPSAYSTLDSRVSIDYTPYTPDAASLHPSFGSFLTPASISPPLSTITSSPTQTTASSSLFALSAKKIASNSNLPTPTESKPLSSIPFTDTSYTFYQEFLGDYKWPSLITLQHPDKPSASENYTYTPYFANSLTEIPTSFQRMLKNPYTVDMLSLFFLILIVTTFVALVFTIFFIMRICCNMCGKRWATKYYSNCGVYTLTILLCLCLGGLIALAVIMIPSAEKVKDLFSEMATSLEKPLQLYLSVLQNMNIAITSAVMALDGIKEIDANIYGQLPYNTLTNSDDVSIIGNYTDEFDNNTGTIQHMGVQMNDFRIATQLLGYYPLLDHWYDANDYVIFGTGIQESNIASLPFINDETYQLRTNITDILGNNDEIISEINNIPISGSSNIVKGRNNTLVDYGMHTFTSPASLSSQTGYYNGTLTTIATALSFLDASYMTSADFNTIIVAVLDYVFAVQDAVTIIENLRSEFDGKVGDADGQHTIAKQIQDEIDVVMSKSEEILPTLTILETYSNRVGNAWKVLHSSLQETKTIFEQVAKKITFVNTAGTTGHSRDPSASPVLTSPTAADLAAIDWSLTHDTIISTAIETYIPTTSPFPSSLSQTWRDAAMVEQRVGALPPLLHNWVKYGRFSMFVSKWSADSVCPAQIHTINGNTHHVFDVDVGKVMYIAAGMLLDESGYKPEYEETMQQLSIVNTTLYGCITSSIVDTAIGNDVYLQEITKTKTNVYVCEQNIAKVAHNLLDILHSGRSTISQEISQIPFSGNSTTFSQLLSLSHITAMVTSLSAALTPLRTAISGGGYSYVRALATLRTENGAYVAKSAASVAESRHEGDVGDANGARAASIDGTNTTTSSSAPSAPLSLSSASGYLRSIFTFLPTSVLSLHSTLTPCGFPALTTLLPPLPLSLAHPSNDDSIVANNYGGDASVVPYSEVVTIEDTQVTGIPAKSVLNRQAEVFFNLQSRKLTTLAPLIAQNIPHTAHIQRAIATRNDMYTDYTAIITQLPHQQRTLESWGLHVYIGLLVAVFLPMLCILFSFCTRCTRKRFRWVMSFAIVCFMSLMWTCVYLAYITAVARITVDHRIDANWMHSVKKTLDLHVNVPFLMLDMELADYIPYYTTCTPTARPPSLNDIDTVPDAICTNIACAPDIVAELATVPGVSPHPIVNHTVGWNINRVPTNMTPPALTYTQSSSSSSTTKAALSLQLASLLHLHTAAIIAIRNSLHATHCENTFPIFYSLLSTVCGKGSEELAFLAILTLVLIFVVFIAFILLMLAYKRFYKKWRLSSRIGNYDASDDTPASPPRDISGAPARDTNTPAAIEMGSMNGSRFGRLAGAQGRDAGTTAVAMSPFGLNTGTNTNTTNTATTATSKAFPGQYPPYISHMNTNVNTANGNSNGSSNADGNTASSAPVGGMGPGAYGGAIGTSAAVVTAQRRGSGATETSGSSAGGGSIRNGNIAMGGRNASSQLPVLPSKEVTQARIAQLDSIAAAYAALAADPAPTPPTQPLPPPYEDALAMSTLQKQPQPRTLANGGGMGAYGVGVSSLPLAPASPGLYEAQNATAAPRLQPIRRGLAGAGPTETSAGAVTKNTSDSNGTSAAVSGAREPAETHASVMGVPSRKTTRKKPMEGGAIAASAYETSMSQVEPYPVHAKYAHTYTPHDPYSLPAYPPHENLEVPSDGSRNPTQTRKKQNISSTSAMNTGRIPIATNAGNGYDPSGKIAHYAQSANSQKNEDVNLGATFDAAVVRELRNALNE